MPFLESRLERDSGLAEHRQFARKPEIPLHRDGNEQAVPVEKEVPAEGDADAVVDLPQKTFVEQVERGAETRANAALVELTQKADEPVRFCFEEVTRMLSRALDGHLIGTGGPSPADEAHGDNERPSATRQCFVRFQLRHLLRIQWDRAASRTS